METKKYYFYKVYGPFVRKHISVEQVIYELLVQENTILRVCKQEGIKIWQEATLIGSDVLWKDIEEPRAKQIIKTANPNFSWSNCW